MATSPSSKSMNVDTNATKRELQDRFVQEIAERIRDRAQALNMSARALGDALGIPSSTAANYWHGKRSWPSEVIPSLADVLNTDVETLLRGRRSGLLVDANDADWVDVPEYSLFEIDELGKLAPIVTSKMRKDWLYSSLGETSGLWMAAAPARYEALGIEPMTMIFCKDHRPGERMIHGVHYLFRINGGVIIARFALREDASEEPTVLPRDIGHDDDQHQVVARIVGQFARPL
jgi:transcriptional regulator with XRE-family HTH domain